VVTGDISEGDDVVLQLKRIADVWRGPVYCVLGKHDFYRSAIGETRRRVIDASRESADLHYLTDCAPIALDNEATVVLIGEDGWGDATEGDYEGTVVRLNDFPMIAAFRLEDPSRWKEHLMQLGADSAERLEAKLKTLSATTRQVLIATHVPPFCDACWYEGKTPDASWAPFFVCGQLGKLLLSHAREHPDRQFTVVCGHTHHDGVAQMADNLVVHTGAALYGRPDMEAIVQIGVDRIAIEKVTGG